MHLNQELRAKYAIMEIYKLFFCFGIGYEAKMKKKNVIQLIGPKNCLKTKFATWI